MHALFKKEDLGTIKLFLTTLALTFRKNNPELFLEGDYIPLQVKGKCKEHVIAFVRRYQDKQLIVIASRLYSKLIDPEHPLPLGTFSWQNTYILLPQKIKKQSSPISLPKKHIPLSRTANYTYLRYLPLFPMPFFPHYSRLNCKMRI